MSTALRGRFSWPALLAVFFWGVSFVALRHALEGFTPFGLVATRLAAGAALLYALLALRGDGLLPSRADLGLCALLGAILGGHLSIQSYAMKLTSAINAGWIVAFIPVNIALGAQLFLAQRLRALGWGGVALASAGVVTVAMSDPPDVADATSGDLLMLGSCVTWATYTLAASGPVARNGALRVTAFAMAVASVLAAPAALRNGFLDGPATPRVLLSTAFLGLCCSGIAFAIWARAVDRDGAARAGAMVYFQPFVTLFASALLLREPITWHALVGGPIVLAGVWLMSRGVERKPAPLPRTAAGAALREG